MSKAIQHGGVSNETPPSFNPKKARPGKGWAWTKTRFARRMFSFCRWVHVYVSTALFSLLVFFCVTGILLNHLSWFESVGERGVTSETIPAELQAALREAGDPPIAALEAFIKKQTGLANPRKIDIDLELGELTFDYPLPAGYAFITVFSEDGVMEVEHQEGTLLALLNDMHKGRHTGPQWSLVIDISALLIILLAVTGLVILFQQAKWRLSGLLLILAGTITPWLIYLLWIPKMS